MPCATGRQGIWGGRDDCLRAGGRAGRPAGRPPPRGRLCRRDRRPLRAIGARQCRAAAGHGGQQAALDARVARRRARKRSSQQHAALCRQVIAEVAQTRVPANATWCRPRTNCPTRPGSSSARGSFSACADRCCRATRSVCLREFKLLKQNQISMFGYYGSFEALMVRGYIVELARKPPSSRPLVTYRLTMQGEQVISALKDETGRSDRRAAYLRISQTV